MLCTVAAACAAAPATALAASALAAGAAPAMPDATTPDATTAISGGSGYAPGVPALLVKPATMLGHVLHIHGVIPLRGAVSHRVLVQRLDHKRGGWRTIAGGRVGLDGHFAAFWRSDHIGRFTLRAVLAGRHRRARATSTPLSNVAVYRAARTSFYGPGFYGHHTACGQLLTPDLQGIAHRTLPCGTLIEVYHAGATLILPVIDRGPFAAGTEWDLTQAAASALGFQGMGTLGFMRAQPA